MQTRHPRTKRATAQPSDPKMPALSPAFAHPDDAARYVHNKIGNRRDKEYGGFILKRSDHKYVATEPISGQAFLFDPNDVFPRNDEEGYVIYPAGHDDYAVYHSHPTLFTGLNLWSDAEKATYPNSFSSADIYAVIDERDLCPASYLSGPDGSLIKYIVSDSALEQALFKRVSGPSHRPAAADLSEVHQRLQAATLLPSDVVRLLAEAGDLQVVVGSALWGTPGRVGSDWKPYPKRPIESATIRTCETIQPLLLSSAFTQTDDAARYVHWQINGRRHADMIGVLLKNPDAGSVLAAEPYVVGEAVYAPCSVFYPEAFDRPALPAGYRIDGFYVAPATADAAQTSLAANFFRPQDFHRAFEYRYIPAKRPKGMPLRYGFTMSEIYFSAPDGALLAYRFSRSNAEYELLRRVSQTYSGSQSIQRQLDNGALTFAEYIRQVVNAGQLRVLEVSANWPRAGRISF
jgi:hypothetical protein